MDDITCPAVVWAWILLTEDDTSTVTSEQELQVEVSDAVSERTEVIAGVLWAEVSNTFDVEPFFGLVSIEKTKGHKTMQSCFYGRF